MDKLDFVRRNDLERIGKHYFEKAVGFVLERDFGKSYEFFKEGLDYVTCDCGEKWTEKISNQVTTFFVDIENSDSNHAGYFFSKAFLYSYFNNKKNLYLGLDAIDKYLKISEDEHGLYVKGKILGRLEEYDEAINYFNLSANINKKCSRLNYRIGRTKEQFLKENGLKYLLDSLIANPSSVCCARVFYSNLVKRGKLSIFKDVSTSNLIIDLFLSEKNEDEFQVEYEKILNLNSTTLLNTDNDFFDTKMTSEFVEILKSVLSNLLEIQNVFIEKKNSQSYNESNYDDTDRDVFDAYSDESYDEWNEGGGDIWSLRESMGY